MFEPRIIQVDSECQQVFGNVEWRPSVDNAILHGAHFKAGHIDSLLNCNRRILMPRHGPVCQGCFVEENSLHRSHGVSQNCDGQVNQWWCVGNLAETGECGKQMADAVRFALPSSRELLRRLSAKVSQLLLHVGRDYVSNHCVALSDKIVRKVGSLGRHGIAFWRQTPLCDTPAEILDRRCRGSESGFHAETRRKFWRRKGLINSRIFIMVSRSDKGDSWIAGSVICRQPRVTQRIRRPVCCRPPVQIRGRP